MVGTKAIAFAKAQPFKIRISKSPDFKWSDFRSPLYHKVDKNKTSLDQFQDCCKDCF